MNDIAFEIAEYERDRELTVCQLDASSGPYRAKYAAQLARIDTRLATLRAVTPGAPDRSPT